MRLSELGARGWAITRDINRELKAYKHTTWWHKRDGEASENMFRWFRDFAKFRRSVLNDVDIEKCLSEWIGVTVTDDPYAVSNTELVKKCTVPQFAMCITYWKILSDIEKEKTYNAS